MKGDVAGSFLADESCKNKRKIRRESITMHPIIVWSSTPSGPVFTQPDEYRPGFPKHPLMLRSADILLSQGKDFESIFVLS